MECPYRSHLDVQEGLTQSLREEKRYGRDNPDSCGENATRSGGHQSFLYGTAAVLLFSLGRRAFQCTLNNLFTKTKLFSTCLKCITK